MIQLQVIEVPQKQFQILDISHGGIVHVEEMPNLTLPDLDMNKGIVLYGSAPVWIYLHILHMLEGQFKKWIAQFDPRKGAIVVATKDNAIPPFSVIPLENIIPWAPFNPKNQKIIAFIGPPHSGKSVFMYALFNQLLVRHESLFLNKAMIIKGCPDGEGRFSNEAPHELVKIIRRKWAWTSEFEAQVIDDIENTKKSKEIIFVDMGGKIADNTRRILQKCTHAVIVSATQQGANEWRNEYNDLEINILADIASRLSKDLANPDIHSKIDKVEGNCWYMTIADLDRSNTNVIIPEDFLKSII